MRVNYYAKLNENKICVGVEKTLMNYDNVSDYIKLENDNESLYGRKWTGDQWSSEIYETGLPTDLQDDINILKEEKKALDITITELKKENSKLLEEVYSISDALEELMTAMVGGDK